MTTERAQIEANNWALGQGIWESLSEEVMCRLHPKSKESSSVGAGRAFKVGKTTCLGFVQGRRM